MTKRLGSDEADLLAKLKAREPLGVADVWRLLRVAKRTARRG